MADWDLLLRNARIATMCESGIPYGVIEDGAIAVSGERIAWLGATAELPDGSASEERTLDGRWITPALIDCHTHLVFGGDRAAEFEQRLAGASYADIARAGGGILATVNATRAASEAVLLASATRRAQALLRDGVATLEIKSGYGLELDSELKSLRVARAIAGTTGQDVRTTLLAAHTVPPEYKDDADGYVDLICKHILPAAADRCFRTVDHIVEAARNGAVLARAR